MFIRGTGKEKYLTGITKEPKPMDPNYDTWMAKNSMMMTWLVNSMIAKVGENYMLASTAKEIWDLAKKTYGVQKNAATIYQLEKMLHGLIQAKKTVLAL